MNKIILNYLLMTILNFKNNYAFYCFGIILNLFEEIEFFKNLDVPILTPLYLTSLYIPGLLLHFCHLLFL